MYELYHGSNRLVWALYSVRDNKRVIKALAHIFNGTFDIIAKNCPKKLVKSKLHGQFLCAHNNYFLAF